MSAASDPLGLAGQMIGQFRVSHAIEGARSGLLYRGWDYAAFGSTGEHAPVWLQFFDSSCSRDPAALVRQSDAWRAFQHPCYLSIVGCEASAGHPPFIAMQAGDAGISGGVVLSDRLAGERLGIVEAVKIAVGVGEVLIDAHEKGLPHLGITDETVVLPKHGDASPRLLGFGVPARFDRADLSAWHYLAPEQIAGLSDCDARADVYALGVLLYRLVTGQYPVALQDGLSVEQTLAQLLLGGRRSVRPQLDVVPIDGGLVAAIECAMCADRPKRFPSMREFMGALRACGLPLTEIPREQSDPKGITMTPPPSAVPEIRAGVNERTMSPALVAGGASGAPKRTTAVLDEGGKPVGVARPIDPIGLVVHEIRIERPIASGGMATVYLGKHVKIDRTWAVKIAELDVAPEAALRFEQEVLVTAKLREHGERRVVEIKDAGKLADGRPYMVMEFIEGKTLEDVLRETPLLPIDRVLKITNSVAETLEHAHDLGFVHRDVKPNNLMIEDGHGGQKHNVRVLDWGVAKASGPEKRSATIVGMMIGTPGYMPTEAILGAQVDGRADVFALACCLYEMLAGRKAFSGEDPPSVMEATMNTHPPSMASLRPEIDAELSELVADGMAKQKDHRPTMAEFRARLFAIMQKIAARRPAGAMTPLSTMLSTGQPVVALPLSQKPTHAPRDEEREDFLVRVIEPEITRPLRADKRTRATRRRMVAGIVAALSVGAVAAGIWLGVARRTAKPAPAIVAAPSSPAIAMPPPIAHSAPPHAERSYSPPPIERSAASAAPATPLHESNQARGDEESTTHRGHHRKPKHPRHDTPDDDDSQSKMINPFGGN